MVISIIYPISVTNFIEHIRLYYGSILPYNMYSVTMQLSHLIFLITDPIIKKPIATSNNPLLNVNKFLLKELPRYLISGKAEISQVTAPAH